MIVIGRDTIEITVPLVSGRAANGSKQRDSSVVSPASSRRSWQLPALNPSQLASRSGQSRPMAPRLMTPTQMSVARPLDVNLSGGSTDVCGLIRGFLYGTRRFFHDALRSFHHAPGSLAALRKCISLLGVSVLGLRQGLTLAQGVEAADWHTHAPLGILSIPYRDSSCPIPSFRSARSRVRNQRTAGRSPTYRTSLPRFRC
jgi:hypothetical protein